MRSRWLDVAGAVLVSSAGASTAPAQERPDGPVSLWLSYRCEPQRRAAFRAYMEDAGSARFDGWKRDGTVAGYAILFSSFVNEKGWDMSVRLDFTRYVDVAKWKRVERSQPGGLSIEALAHCAPVGAQLADQAAFGEARQRHPRGVFLVVPYQLRVGRPEYKRYFESYVRPQMEGWIAEGALSSYSMYLNHHAAGEPWDSLLVLEYAGEAGLSRREVVKDAVRRRLREDAAWKAASDAKQEVRDEGEIVLADLLEPAGGPTP